MGNELPAISQLDGGGCGGSVDPWIRGLGGATAAKNLCVPIAIENSIASITHRDFGPSFWLAFCW